VDLDPADNIFIESVAVFSANGRCKDGSELLAELWKIWVQCSKRSSIVPTIARAALTFALSSLSNIDRIF
jgi:hypothetical protein